MKCNVKSIDGDVFAQLSLADDGTVEIITDFDSLRDALQQPITQPGTMKRLTVADGEAFLRALPANWRAGNPMYAELVEA